MAGSTKGSVARRISRKNSCAIGACVAPHRIDELGCPKKNGALWRHPRFTYRFNNRGSLYIAVFEWLIRCLQPCGRHTMLLEVISQPLCASTLSSFFSFSLLGSRLMCPPSLLFFSHPITLPQIYCATVNLFHHAAFRWLHSYASNEFLLFLT